MTQLQMNNMQTCTRCAFQHVVESAEAQRSKLWFALHSRDLMAAMSVLLFLVHNGPGMRT